MLQPYTLKIKAAHSSPKIWYTSTKLHCIASQKAVVTIFELTGGFYWNTETILLSHFAPVNT